MYRLSYKARTIYVVILSLKLFSNLILSIILCLMTDSTNEFVVEKGWSTVYMHI